MITSSLLVGAIITFIALPFLTRLYSVHDFGQYGVALAIVSVLSTIANLRLDQAQLVADDADQKSLIFEGSVFSLIFCVLSAGVLSFFFDSSMILAICFGVLSNTVLQSLYNYKFAHEAEVFCAGLNIYRSLIVVVAQLSLPLLMSISLVCSYAVSSVIMLFTVLLYIAIHGLYQVSWSSYKNYKDFIFSNTPHALLNSFSHNLPYYVVSHFIGYQAVGFYAIVERTLRVPINLMSQTIRQFFIRKFKHADSPREALKSSVFLSLISLPFFALFFVLPESLYLMIFGQHWVGISLYFQILALGYWAVFCNPPSSAYLIAKRNSQQLFKLQIVELIIKFTLFAALYMLIDNKMYMLLAVPASLIFYNFAILYVVWRNPK
ncbi:oligosaccharide flippase family protein [Acinetobacter portensis]|uniref:Oligosaccharide flippase family protein n=2 Tax=Acinetobacter TaxID=469 RepID=A0ABU5GHI0_9GAMM|nr:MULTISPECIES: oligosaccharide flippase family protein [Acinetobacter]MCK7609533.1 oligosaccharide flippase family protein [Acinetobacter portensis]MCK7640278.1 oligosaccharide flippase family protein [Acinetobacter portensis]MDY6459779.1 oligosaccharide flippase family protein [Acinetobacter faecalis]MDY6484062.1 oligosaccharide flippase family protein [Acinetobacter faecalis]MDY6523971.1 oligosaccharide flippase family protein [Acinetobacter faecalis]